MLIKHYFLAGKQTKRQEITQLMLLMLKNCEGHNEGQDRTTLQPIHHRYVLLQDRRVNSQKGLFRPQTAYMFPLQIHKIEGTL
jgi:hypothetical protein